MAKRANAKTIEVILELHVAAYISHPQGDSQTHRRGRRVRTGRQSVNAPRVGLLLGDAFTPPEQPDRLP